MMTVVLVHLILTRKLPKALGLNLIFFLRFLSSSLSPVGILRIHLHSGFAFLLISAERLLASGCVFSN